MRLAALIATIGLLASPVFAADVTVNNNQDGNPRPPVSSAAAVTTALATDVCMGASNVGAQGVTFGISVGTSWTDTNCTRLKKARALNEFGYRGAAVRVLCEDKAIEKAMADAGTPCEAVKGMTPPK